MNEQGTDLQEFFSDLNDRITILETQVGEQLTKAYGKDYEKPRFIKAEDEADCKKKGGKWDPETKKCLLVPEKKEGESHRSFETPLPQEESRTGETAESIRDWFLGHGLEHQRRNEE